MQEGDYLTCQFEDGMYHVVKILKITPNPPPMADTFHVMSFRELPNRPGPEDVDRLEVVALHAPVLSTGFPGAEVFANRPVTPDELKGFFIHMVGDEMDFQLAGRIYSRAAKTFPDLLQKAQNFQQYARESGRSIEEFAETARQHYNEGCRLADDRELHSAEAQFTLALEAFPLYFEAIDNRGITYRDLGDFDKASDDFALSFAIYPGGHVAFFSLGECQLKKGNVKGAKRIFTEALKRWPEHAQRARHYLAFIEHQTGGTQKPKETEKKKWKFW